MAKRKKQTQLQKEYTRQRRRIQQFIRRNEKRGFIFDENALPQIPKKITKSSISRLEKITPNVLYKKAIYGGEETQGEIVTVEQGRKLERKHKKARNKASNKKSINVSRETSSHPKRVNTDLDFWSRSVLDHFKFTLEDLRNGKAYPLLKSWFNTLIQENGAENVAKMLQDAGDKGYFLTREIAYKVEKARSFMNSVMDFLPEQGVIYKDSVMDRLDYSRKLEEAVEQDEGWEEY